MKKRNDIILVLLLILITGASYLIYRYTYRDTGANLKITVDGSIYVDVPLAKSDIFYITGKYGTNCIEVKDGYVRMISAECPDQICVHHTSIHYNGETIICLPNKIIVEITGGEESAIDGLVQ